jgi:hypothetical protein
MNSAHDGPHKAAVNDWVNRVPTQYRTFLKTVSLGARNKSAWHEWHFISRKDAKLATLNRMRC